MDYRDRVLAAVKAFYESPKARERVRSEVKPKKKRAHPEIPTESEIQIKIAGLLDQLTVDGEPLVWFHPPLESYGISPISARRRKLSGAKKGCPDILIFSKGPLSGRPTAIELKRLKYSSTTAEQRDWLQRLSNVGWDAHICKGYRAALEVLRAAGYVS